ncbi:hypothetical protein TrLO_g11435 [Triparma laevis f. longispina]|uniref:Uncharacterized protein n=1 Tax=Triparma laevis f. longispina TaxID=1714387 RepID=A0A9W7DW46_9STRA|nr:hypothetical protein TrLO_g11435 [Triparma laevis f. longispina]
MQNQQEQNSPPPAYNPSAYASLNPGHVPSRNWQFTDYEDKPIAYIGLSSSGFCSNGKEGKDVGSSAAVSLNVLKDILRNGNRNYREQCLHGGGLGGGKKGKQPWEVSAAKNYEVGKVGKKTTVSSVPYHSSERVNVAPRENVSGDELFAAKMKLKHCKTFDMWRQENEGKGNGMKDIDRAESIKKRKKAQERKLLAEAKFDEWMKTRGMRKMELIGKMEEEPMEVKESRVYDKEYKPWRKFMKSEAEESEDRIKKSELERLELEEKEGREKLSHGIFLEWLSEKESSRKEDVKERKKGEKEEKERKRTSREAKWMKKAVVNCHGGEIAKEMTSLGVRVDGRGGGGGGGGKAWKPGKLYCEEGDVGVSVSNINLTKIVNKT